MEPDYYIKYYHFERSHWWFTVRARIISDIISKQVKPSPDSRVLNVGAATGASSEWLKPFGRVVSLESDPDTCRFLRDQLQMEVIEGSVSRLPFPDSHFDMVCAFDVLEHVEEDTLAMKEMKRVLKTGGLLMLTVPAFRFLWSSHDLVNHHKRRYTKKAITHKLTAIGFKIPYSSYFNSLLFPPIVIYRLLGKMKKRNHSDFESALSGNKWLNRIFRSIFDLERKMLKFIRFPAGVSIITAARKS